MDHSILEWLLEEKNPEVRLRTLKEYKKLPEDDPGVAECKKMLLQSKIYERGLKKLRTDKPWAKYDAILAFAEWGLTRTDIGEDIDGEVFYLIESTGFKMLCGEPLLLRNLVKLGYGQETVVKNEIDSVLRLIKENGGFGCISTSKKINDPRKPHKSCARTWHCLLIAGPDLSHAAIFKSMAKHFFHGFRHNTPSPERLTRPVSHLTFIVLISHIGMAVQLQFYCTDSLAIFFQTDGISLFAVEDILYYIQALFNTLMGRPTGNRTHIRITGISV